METLGNPFTFSDPTALFSFSFLYQIASGKISGCTSCVICSPSCPSVPLTWPEDETVALTCDWAGLGGMRWCVGAQQPRAGVQGPRASGPVWQCAPFSSFLRHPAFKLGCPLGSPVILEATAWRRPSGLAHLFPSPPHSMCKYA